jgi:hypothetical protein
MSIAADKGTILEPRGNLGPEMSMGLNTLRRPLARTTSAGARLGSKPCNRKSRS